MNFIRFIPLLSFIVPTHLSYAASIDSVASDNTDILWNVFLNSNDMYKAGSMSMENPALEGWHRPASECNGTVRYISDKADRAIESGKGKGSMDWEMGAEAYILTTDGCVSGKAGYVNGKMLSPIWNESGEYDRVYPYLLADSIGGDLHIERYYFTGGYSHRNNDITWGVEGGYTATLSYRNVDPRPRNVAGDLTIKGGFSYRIFHDYLAGVAMRYNRYRLSTDISFVNETGETKLFHLTGLGTHYSRFDGAGSSVFNDCHTGGFSLNLFPMEGKGIFINADFSIMGMRHVIADINRLPLAGLNEKDIRIQAGYKNVDVNHRENDIKYLYGVWGEWDAYRRHGHENIFGDASSGSYPQIGSLTLYSDNSLQGILEGYIGYKGRTMNFYILPRMEWSHRRILYAAPRREWLDNHFNFGAEARMTMLVGKRSLISAGAKTAASVPTSTLLSLPEPGVKEEDKSLYEMTFNDFTNITSKNIAGGVYGEWLLKFSGRLAIGITAEYAYTYIYSGVNVNKFSIGITAAFK